MKKYIIVSAIVMLAAVSVCAAASKKKTAIVKYQSSIHCKSCADKVMNNIAFEKGVEDLEVSVKDQTITVEFNMAKTDTTKLSAAIKKLGYNAKVVEYKESDKWKKK